MRLYLVQSRDSGDFLVPEDGYVGWTKSLRQALICGLVDEVMAHQLAQDHADDADIIFVYSDECNLFPRANTYRGTYGV